MDYDPPVQEAQNAQGPMVSQHSSEALPLSRKDAWNSYKDEIYKIYIQKNHTLKTTMQAIEGRGGPKARWVPSRVSEEILILSYSQRTWKSKLKEWAYEKNLSSNDMNTISTEARKRKREMLAEKIQRSTKAAKVSEMASPSAGEYT